MLTATEVQLQRVMSSPNRKSIKPGTLVRLNGGPVGIVKTGAVLRNMRVAEVFVPALRRDATWFNFEIIQEPADAQEEEA